MYWKWKLLVNSAFFVIGCTVALLTIAHHTVIIPVLLFKRAFNLDD